MPNTVYFGGQATTTPLLIISGYALAGVLLSLAASTWLSRREVLDSQLLRSPGYLSHRPC